MDSSHPEWTGRRGKVAGVLAKEHDVSARTIAKDGKFAEAVEVVKKVEPDSEKRLARSGAPKRTPLKFTLAGRPPPIP